LAVFLTLSRRYKIYCKVDLRAVLSSLSADWRFRPDVKSKSQRLRVMNISMQYISRQLVVILRRRLSICSVKR
jgi:hypothetical protein